MVKSSTVQIVKIGGSVNTNIMMRGSDDPQTPALDGLAQNQEAAMKGYRKIHDADISFDDGMDLADDDLYNQEELMRSILGHISAYAEKTGCRKYTIMVYALRVPLHPNHPPAHKIRRQS